MYVSFCLFVQMRDRVSDRKFLLQKKVENRIENAIPEKFRSGYAMVCYGGIGNVSYRNAHTLSRVQANTAFLFCFLVRNKSAVQLNSNVV